MAKNVNPSILFSESFELVGQAYMCDLGTALFLLMFRVRITIFCKHEIRTSTSSMTSVPKPLKFLRPHYGTLKAYYEAMAELDLKVFVLYDMTLLFDIVNTVTVLN